MTNPIFCAVDRPDLEGALTLVRALAPHVGGIKLGLEFFTAQGPRGVEAVARQGLPIFLDLKLHDIPNTVAGAVREVATLGVAYLTLHVAGGRAMLEAAAAVPGRPALLGVTVLTSLDAADLADLGIAAKPDEQALRLGGSRWRPGSTGWSARRSRSRPCGARSGRDRRSSCRASARPRPATTRSGSWRPSRHWRWARTCW